MPIIYTFNESERALFANSVKPIAELHRTTESIAVFWLAKAICEDVVSHGAYMQPTRSGTMEFEVGSRENRVVVEVEVVRLYQTDTEEGWIGRSVTLTAPGWMWSYTIDWKTGNRMYPIQETGNYPYAHVKLEALA